METKLFKACAYFLISSILFCSCNKNDEVVPAIPEKDQWYYGYFKGEMDGLRYDLKNKQDDRKIVSYPCIIGYPFVNTDPDKLVNYFLTDIYCTDFSLLSIVLCGPLEVGVRYINTPLVSGPEDNGSIVLELYTSPEKTPYSLHSIYKPSKDNPFRVEITDIDWIDPRHPVIEAKLDGVLWNNKYPPGQAIVINATYGGAR